MQISNKIQQFSINDTVIINPNEINSYLENVSSRLSNYQSYIDSKYDNLSSILNNLNIEVDQAVLDGILNSAELKSIQLATEEFKSQVKSIVAETQDVLNQLYVDNSALLDNEVYTFTNYTYIPTQKPYVLQISPKKNPAEVGCRDALQWCLSELNEDVNSKTVYSMFLRCINALCISDTNPDTPDIDINKDLLDQYYQTRDAILNHINITKNVLVVSKKRIQEKIVAKQTSELNKLVDEQKSYVDAIRNSLANQIDGVLDSYFLPGPPSTNVNSKVVSGWINDASVELNLTTKNANVNNTSTQTLFNRHIGDTYTDILPYEVNLEGEAAKWFILGDIKQNLNSLYENNLVESLTHYRTHDLFTYEPGTQLKNNNENLQIVVCYYNASKVLKHVEYVNPGETTTLQQSDEFSYIGLLIYPNDTIDLTTVSIVHDNVLKYINAGRSWRFCNFDDEDITTYHWHEIADSDAILALQKAAEAQDTADGKRTVFSTQPTVPYYMGDLWIAPGADISICAMDNTDHSLGFVNEHWVKASKYTDDTLAAEAIEEAKSAKQSAEEAAKRFADMANDGMVDPIEKTSLRAEYTSITEQHSVLLSEVANIKSLYNKEIDTTDLEKAKNDLKEYLTTTLHIWDEPDIAQPINRNEFNSITNAWYNESIIISNAIAKYTAEGISQTYSDALQEKIDAISEEQKNALKLLDDMSSDGVLDPAEKLRVQTQYIEITSQHNENVKLANLYKGLVDISALVNYYDNLTSYLVESPCFIYNGKSSEIDRGDFNKVFENWYNENVKVLTLLQNVVSKEEAEKVKADVQKEIDEANKAAEEAAKMLNDMMSDGILDAAEKIKIRQQLKEIEAEHTETILIANDYIHFGNVSTGINNLITAYSTLTNAMQLYNIDSSTSEEIDRETFDDPFINWHKYNTQLLSAVSFAMAEQEANNVKIDIQDEIRNSAQMAIEAQNMLNDMLDDSKIDKSEKVRLRKELDEISVQHTTNVALANDYGLPTVDIQNAFNNLSEYLIDVIVIYSDETKLLGENDRTNLNAYFSNWYQENTKLLNNISYVIATDVVVDLSTAISTKIDGALAEAAESKALVADIMDDGVIDPSEKTRLKQQLSEIQTQHVQNREHAVIFDVEPQYIQDIDNALQYLEDVLVNICGINNNESTRNADRTILNGAFNEWHNCNVILLNKISDKQAAHKTEEMQQEVNKMIADASNAQAATQALVDAILDDNTIDPAEKTRLKLQFAEITTSYNDLIELSEDNNIKYDDYILLTNAYNALKSYLEGACSINTTGNTGVNREEFSKKFTDYYKEYNTLLNKVQTAIAQKEASAIAKEQEGFINALQKSLDEYAKKQEDGHIVSYFLPGNPTTSNKPASEWPTYEAALEHVGDTYTNSDESDPDYGKSWRWCVDTDCDDPSNNLQFHWHEITDPLTLKALQAAENAQDTADGKRRVFVTQPTPPYDKGDLWVTTIDNDGDGENDMYVANTPKLEGEKFDKNDWQPATSTFKQLESLQEDINAARAALDEFAEDGILTALEKKSVRTIFSDISTNHASDQATAQSLNLQNSNVYKNEDTAFKNLSNLFLNTLKIYEDSSTTINRTDYTNKLNSWYTANASLDASISDKIANDKAGEVRDELYESNKDLQEQIDGAKDEIATYADDNVITALEKRSIKQLFDDISTNHNADRTLYATYGGNLSDSVCETENSAYTILQSFLINTVRLSSSTNTTLSNGQRNAYNSYLNNWYVANKKLDSSITALKAILEAQTSAAAIAAELHAQNSSLQEQLDSAKKDLLSFADDNVITALEKRSIKQLFDDISTNHTIDQELYVTYNGHVGHNVYIQEMNTYTSLSSFLTNNIKISSSTNTQLSNGDRNAYNTLLNNWYVANKNLDAYITQLKAKYEVSEASTYFMQKNNELQTQINAAKSELVSFADDGVLTPVEKKQMRTTLTNITTNHTNDQTLAKSLNLSNQAVYIHEETAYSNLYRYLVNTVNINTSVSSTINRSELSAYLDAWYAANAKLDTSIKNKMAQNEIDKAARDLSARMDEVATSHASTYLNAAIEQDTDIQGGLVLSSLIQLRGADGSINAGMSGMDYVKRPDGQYVSKSNLDQTTNSPAHAAKDDTLLWAGGDYTDAWKAQYGLQKLPVRLTKSGIGSNIGPFKVSDKDVVVVESNNGNVEIDADKGIYVYDDKNNLSLALHNSNSPQYTLPVHNTYWAGMNFKNTYQNGGFQVYSSRNFSYGNSFKAPTQGQFEFNSNIPNKFSVTFAIPEKSAMYLLKKESRPQSLSYSNINNITDVIKSNFKATLKYVGLKFYEFNSINDITSISSISVKNLVEAGNWYGNYTTIYDTIDKSNAYIYKSCIFEYDYSYGNLIICDDPIYLDQVKVENKTRPAYAQAIGLYSHMTSFLPNSFNPTTDIKITVGKPKKTMIKSNDSKTSFYITSYNAETGKCTGKSPIMGTVDVSAAFIQKSTAETDEDLLKNIYEHLSSIEPATSSYFWYVFNVDFDFSDIFYTNRLKFTYDLIPGKQYMYGLGFNLTASIDNAGPIYGLGFNDNIQSGFILKDLQNTTQLYRDKFILCDKSYGQRFEVTLGNKNNEINPLFMNIVGLPNEEMVVSMCNNSDTHPYKNFLNSGLVYVDTNGYLRLYGNNQSGVNIN